MTPGTVQYYQLVLATGPQTCLAHWRKVLKRKSVQYRSKRVGQGNIKISVKGVVLMTFMVSLGLNGGIPNEKL